MIEMLTLRLAGPAIKLLANWVLPESTAEPVGAGLADLVDSRLGAFEERRKINRFLEDLQDEVGTKLADALQALFPKLKPEELAAATLAVGSALGKSDLTTAVARANLDPDELYGRVRQNPELDFTLLGGDAGYAADFLLRQTCYYLVRVVDKLPDFRTSLGREILLRSAALSDEIRKVLEAVNALTQNSHLEARQSVDAFETSYRLTLVRGLEQLQMFGIKQINKAAGNYPLSVAYVALSAKGGGNADSLPVQDALVGRRRLLLRGEAGSGKTTLMQWLAVRGASMDFPPSLSTWSRLIPIYIRLRDYVDQERDFPTPEAMLRDGIAANVAALMPAGWIHAVLGARALVLLDGADELPSSQRRRMCRWVARLLTDFPNAICVISSRPAGLDLAELPNTFTELTLEPMRLRQSEELVMLWHEAVSTNMVDQSKLLQLERSRKAMQAALPVRPALRALASNPLLCAMMCALNLEFDGKIPSDRMTLYQLAIEMLVERRDADREIESDVLQRVGSTNIQEVLDRLAYWMLRNGQSEASMTDVITQLGRLLPRHGPGLKPEEVLQALLERSGVLRQPEHGVVDFLHKSFMEFMGARAAVADNDFGLLADHAQQESWREAVVFAVGHARGLSRDRLVRRLLDKPLIRLGRRSRQSDITVVCALETGSKDLDPEVLSLVLQRATTLFPPIEPDHAWSLAPAAAARPELLIGHEGVDEGQIASCIRCASVVGEARMLSVIAGYSEVDKPLVRRQLFESWSSFNGTDYGLRVISRMPWFSRLIEVPESEGGSRDQLLRFLELLCYRGEHQDEATLAEYCLAFMRGGIVNLGGIASLTPLVHINELLFGRKGLLKISTLDLDRLADIGPVKAIRVRAPIDEGALERAQALAPLVELQLDTFAPKEKTDWPRFSSLSTLALRGYRHALPQLGDLGSLRTLALSGKTRLDNYLLGQLLPRLEILAIAEEGIADSLRFVASPSLTTLVLIGDGLADRGKLDVTSCPRLRTVVWVSWYPIQLTISAGVQELCLGGSWLAVNGDVSGLKVCDMLSGRFRDGGAFLERASQLVRLAAGLKSDLSQDVEAALNRRGVQLVRDVSADQCLWPYSQ